MVLYQSTAGEFIREAENGVFLEKMKAAFAQQFHKIITDPKNHKEFGSWEKSDAGFMKEVLKAEGIPGNLGVMVEYAAPGCIGRIDMALSGIDADGVPTVLLIELKQWGTVEKKLGGFVVDGEKSGTIRKHPLLQAMEYRDWIRYSIPEGAFDFQLFCCAFLHNYEGDRELFEVSRMENEHPGCKVLFTVSEMAEYIRSIFKAGDGGAALFALEEKCIGNSGAFRRMLDHVAEDFVDLRLSPDQKEIYDLIGAAVDESLTKEGRTTILAKGGPGTGKSVIALKALFDNYRKPGLEMTGRCLYLSKNKAPREVLLYSVEQKENEEKSTGVTVQLKNLVWDSGYFARMNRGGLDAVLTLVDESQRLNNSTVVNGKSISSKKQIEEIVEHSRVSVFFIDMDQVVTLADAGRIEQIRAAAEQYGSELIVTEELKAQFRCGNANGYVDWVDELLGIRENDAIPTTDYDVKVSENFAAFLADLRAFRKRGKTRMVSGYCWDWKSKNDTTGSIYDIEIEEDDVSYRLRMNKNPLPLGNREYDSNWYVDADQDSYVGCIHTCQGLEADYVGVIIGPDLALDAEHHCLVTKPELRAEGDFSSNEAARQNFKWRTGGTDADVEKALDTIIRNTYRVLLTRGLKGCRIYCVDRALGEAIAEAIPDPDRLTGEVKTVKTNPNGMRYGYIKADLGGPDLPFNEEDVPEKMREVLFRKGLRVSFLAGEKENGRAEAQNLRPARRILRTVD